MITTAIAVVIMSLPSRGAWIEIIIHYGHIRNLLSRSPRGERGLKSKIGICIPAPLLVAPLAGSVD